jgi:hypothetical protein
MKFLIWIVCFAEQIEAARVVLTGADVSSKLETRDAANEDGEWGGKKKTSQEGQQILSTKLCQWV